METHTRIPNPYFMGALAAFTHPLLGPQIAHNIHSPHGSQQVLETMCRMGVHPDIAMFMIHAINTCDQRSP